MTPEEQAAADAKVAETAVVEETPSAEAIEEEQVLQAAFEAGLTGAEIEPTEKTPPADANQDTPRVEDVPNVEEKVETPAPVEPVLAKITEAQFQDILAKSKTVDEVRSGMEKLRGDAFGKIGGLERVLKQLQESTPVGQAIEVTDKDLEEIREEYPDLTVKLAKVFTRVLGRFKGTGAPAPGQTDEAFAERVNSLADARVAHVLQEREERAKAEAAEALTSMHKDWREVIGPKDSDTNFRKWLKTQGQEYEEEVLDSWNPRVLSTAIRKFKTHEETQTKKPAPPANGQDARSRRLAEAIPARGGAAPPAGPQPKTLEDEFLAGLNSR